MDEYQQPSRNYEREKDSSCGKDRHPGLVKLSGYFMCSALCKYM